MSIVHDQHGPGGDHLQADDLITRTHAVVARAQRRLLSLQEAAGCWRGEFQTTPATGAFDLMFREFFGSRSDDVTGPTAAWIRSCQEPEGYWTAYHRGPGSLSTTAACYTALRLAGDDPGEEHMRLAREFILAEGGVEQCEPWLAVWLAFLGLLPWTAVPALPPELMLVPRSAPVSLADLAWWTNSMLVPLTVCTTYRPTHDCGFTIDELKTGAPIRYLRALPPPARAALRAMTAYCKRPNPRARRRGLDAAEDWILSHQDDNGLFEGGILFSTQFCVIALLCLGYSKNHPVVRRAVEGMDLLVLHDGPHRRVEFCNPTLADTAVAMTALRYSGMPADHDALRRAAEWLLARQSPYVDAHGQTIPGGWGWQDGNVSHPDLDDTMMVALALEGLEVGEPGTVARALAGARQWAFTLQHRSGGWRTFDPPTNKRRLPWSDFLVRRELVETECVDVTAHAVEWLSKDGFADDPRVKRAVAWLLRQQCPDGSWPSVWACNHIYGTTGGIRALVAAGFAPTSPPVTAATRWLIDHQNDDGGWGEDPRSYDDPAWIGRGPSTLQQTAFALLGLIEAHMWDADAVRRGVRYLVDGAAESEDVWAEPWHCYPVRRAYEVWGRDPLWALMLPLVSLGKYLQGVDSAHTTADTLRRHAVVGEVEVVGVDSPSPVERP